MGWHARRLPVRRARLAGAASALGHRARHDRRLAVGQAGRDLGRRRPEDLEYWMSMPADHRFPQSHVPGGDPEMESIARRAQMRDIEQNNAALRDVLGGSYKTDGPRDLADLFPHARMSPYAPSKTAERVHSGMNVDVVDLGNGQYAVMSTEDAHSYYKLKNRLKHRPW